jgi:hypothetical protein
VNFYIAVMPCLSTSWTVYQVSVMIRAVFGVTGNTFGLVVQLNVIAG